VNALGNPRKEYRRRELSETRSLYHESLLDIDAEADVKEQTEQNTWLQSIQGVGTP